MTDKLLLAGQKELLKSIKSAHKELVTKTRYSLDESLLTQHINNSHDIENAYFKVTLINAFYSTRMGADLVYQAARHIEHNQNSIKQIIQKNSIDEDDLNNINIFCHKKLSRDKLNENKEDYNPYSFFTKYLAIHDRIVNKKEESKLPIYDTLVEKVIKSSDLIDGKFNLRNYSSLFKTLNTIGKDYGGFSSIDNILWTLGRFIFQNKQKKEDQILTFKRRLSSVSIPELVKEIILMK